MSTFDVSRHGLVEHLARAGIHDGDVLRAVREVPREAFLPPELEEFAYRDAPLPIGEDQTISQPLIVALMAQAARLEPHHKVLEVGTGSGYAAAVFARIADEVYSIERLPGLGETARQRLAELGYANVHVRIGDGTLGWPDAAPFDAILVAAGGPDPPASLMDQLAPGGRLVIPVGVTPREQRLVCIERRLDRFVRSDLGGVRFVPLVGAEGWSAPAERARSAVVASPGPRTPRGTPVLIRETCEPIEDIVGADLGSLLAHIGGARVVLVGEATHGTSEFYRMRARITRELIERNGFAMVAIEGDWPDAAQIHRWAGGMSPNGEPPPFVRFPIWMWRNRETAEFLAWLRSWNASRPADARVGFHGLDLYSLYTSIDAVLDYLDEVDPEAARLARERYGCLTPWQRDPATYGQAVLTGRYRGCENDVVAMLRDLLARRLEYVAADGERYLDAVQNARLVADAERYYRVMYQGGHDSWNLRDHHMFDTLRLLLGWRGEGAKAVVWAHNSHVGNAEATEMGAHGQETIGGLCRAWLGDDAFLIGFGTDHGTVAAASDWGGRMEIKALRPARPGSYEALCTQSEVPAFILQLRDPAREAVRDELGDPRLERAVGVIYRPETELQSHYFRASLPGQFDSYVWFDETRAVEAARGAASAPGLLDTYPFGV